jgi:rubrerythrin
MSEPQKPAPILPAIHGRITKVCAKDDAVICERCGVEMFRMHAVWRCPNCRFKTDCCGW